MADLKTNYKDRLLDTSVNTERKFNLVDSDGNVIVSEVSLRDITQYSQTGDTFGAADINKITAKINEQNNNLTANDLKFQFATDGEGNYGYLGADDSFIPFKSNIELLGKTLPISLVSTRVDGGSINAYVDFIPCGDFLKINVSRGHDKSLVELYGKINVSDSSYTQIWSSDISNSNINQMCNIKGYKILRIFCSDKKDQYEGVWTSSTINGSLVFL